MKVVKIANGFKEMPDPYLLVRSNVIHTAMTGNPHFQTPSPTLAELSSAATVGLGAVRRAIGSTA